MKVSILVPVYGAAEYIGQCAASLFNQTYGDIEFVFVDDCTPDNSIDIISGVLERYPDRRSRVRIVTHGHNRGVGAARATAFGAATGEYIMYVDADDIIPADAVFTLVDTIERGHADIADGAFVYYTGGDGDFVCQPCHDINETYIRKMLLQNAVPHQLWARLFRRSTLADHDLTFVEGINLAEDYSFMPRALFHAKRAVTDSVVYYYRIDRQGVFTNNASPTSIMSYLRANALVCRFFSVNDTARRYSFALQTGLINAFAIGMRAGMTYGEVSAICGYAPQSLFFRACHIPLTLLHSPGVARRVYQVIKRLYRMFACGELRQGNSIHVSYKNNKG